MMLKTKAREYRWYILGGVVLASIILILALTVGDHDPHPVPPGPGPGPTPESNNPYEVSNVYNDESKIAGTLQIDATATRTTKDLGATFKDDAIKADPSMIPEGPNNKLSTFVGFEFGQSDWKTSYVRLSQMGLEHRYSPPSDVVNKPNYNPLMRLEMSGLQIYEKPFGFQYTN
jgi:hypothetical protein